MELQRQEKKGSGRRAGYSLVEVTLALLVVAIGLVATFALFPEGLKATRAAVDDTEVALFADYVFTTLDLTAGKYGGNYGAGWGISDTDDFISRMLSTSVTATNFQLRDGGGREQFYWIPDYYGLASGDYQASNFQNFWTSAFTYTLDVRVSTWKGYGSGVPTYAVLKVWPGEYTGVAPKGEPRIFYREILPLR
jgi:hypothetical protein